MTRIINVGGKLFQRCGYDRASGMHVYERIRTPLQTPAPVPITPQKGPSRVNLRGALSKVANYLRI